MYIRTKNDLINFIASSPHVRPAIKRAIENGKYENLGGFNLNGIRGWTVKFWGIKQKWYVFVKAIDLTGYLVVELAPLRFERQKYWKYWDGDKTENPLYQGDNPEKYKELKDEENA